MGSSSTTRIFFTTYRSNSAPLYFVGFLCAFNGRRWSGGHLQQRQPANQARHCCGCYNDLHLRRQGEPGEEELAAIHAGTGTSDRLAGGSCASSSKQRDGAICPSPPTQSAVSPIASVTSEGINQIIQRLVLSKVVPSVKSLTISGEHYYTDSSDTSWIEFDVFPTPAAMRPGYGIVRKTPDGDWELVAGVGTPQIACDLPADVQVGLGSSCLPTRCNRNRVSGLWTRRGQSHKGFCIEQSRFRYRERQNRGEDLLFRLVGYDLAHVQSIPASRRGNRLGLRNHEEDSRRNVGRSCWPGDDGRRVRPPIRRPGRLGIHRLYATAYASARMIA